MVTQLTFTDPARDADGLKRGVVRDVQIICVDQGAGVFYLAAQPDGVTAHGRVKAAAGFGNVRARQK